MPLQGAWPFSEGVGSLGEDTSGNNRDATGVPGWTAGHTGNGMQINGTGVGAHLDIPASYWMHEATTLMCWVKFNVVTGVNQKIFSIPRAYGDANGHNVMVNTSGQIVARNQATVTITGPILTADQWYHVAFAFDWMEGGAGANSQLYIDGSLVGSSTNINPLADEGGLYWGSGNDLPINGVLDDARWYDHQLTQAEIQSSMNTPVPGVLESSGTTRFMKDTTGRWKPLRTQRVIIDPGAPVPYGWQLAKKDVGLNKHGINGTMLAEYSGPSKPPSGTVIIGKKISRALDLSNGNITIERCYIRPTTISLGATILNSFDNNAVQPGSGPVIIRDCTVDGGGLTTQQSAMCLAIKVIGTVSGNYVHTVGSGIAVYGVGDQYDCTVENNYVTNLTAWGDPGLDGNHSDGFTIRDFSRATVPTRQLKVQNNRFDCSSANATGAMFIQTYSGNIDHALVEGNLLEGGGYNFDLHQMNGYTYSNIHVSNNRFNPSGYGPASRNGGSGPSTWTDNYINNPGQPDNIGTVVILP